MFALYSSPFSKTHKTTDQSVDYKTSLFTGCAQDSGTEHISRYLHASGKTSETTVKLSMDGYSAIE